MPDRKYRSSEGKILGEIADLLIEIRDRLPVTVEEPAQDTPETGPVLVQEVPAEPVKRKPGRSRKVAS